MNIKTDVTVQIEGYRNIQTIEVSLRIWRIQNAYST